MIRMWERGDAPATIPVETDFSAVGRFQVVHRGSKIALFGLGAFFPLAQAVAAKLREKGLDPTLVNPRFASDVDEALVADLAKDHALVVTLEDGVVAGGFGEKVARVAASHGLKVRVKGAPKKFEDRYSLQDLLQRCGLTVGQVVEDCLRV